MFATTKQTERRLNSLTVTINVNPWIIVCTRTFDGAKGDVDLSHGCIAYDQLE